MKASDYAEIYNQYKDLFPIMEGFLDDTESLMRKRNPRCDSAVIAVFRELEQKYQAFCRLTGAPRTGYQRLIETIMPDLFTRLVALGLFNYSEGGPLHARQ
jgi:hypothetical protein